MCRAASRAGYLPAVCWRHGEISDAGLLRRAEAASQHQQEVPVRCDKRQGRPSVGPPHQPYPGYVSAYSLQLCLGCQYLQVPWSIFFLLFVMNPFELFSTLFLFSWLEFDFD
ncbi:unnamed protein product [Linum tenue]|uniref:Uncharacterized protein n=1 Tax=Linum tenue TaxID=586396 RepID=A0AAV0J278_9ROSI|nr:unnamed protein product [Linum tenue]